MTIMSKTPNYIYIRNLCINSIKNDDIILNRLRIGHARLTVVITC